MAALLIIIGPTASGKTALAERIAQRVQGELINADMGQMYVPLTIGTAKPVWATTPFKQHLFDLYDQPIDMNAATYRSLVADCITKIEKRHHLPIVVGGTGFYVQSLFYQLAAGNAEAKVTTGTWQDLYALDPVRASQIHKNDLYRIRRALTQYQATGKLPSEHQPAVSLIVQPIFLVVLTPDRTWLKERIALRVKEMFTVGWIEEVRALSPSWRAFVERKKIIGYPELLQVLNGSLAVEQAHALIVTRTYQYAKKQMMFNAMLVKKLQGIAGIKVMTLSSADLSHEQADDLIVSFMHDAP